jgi:hypothetical protein
MVSQFHAVPLKQALANFVRIARPYLHIDEAIGVPIAGFIQYRLAQSYAGCIHLQRLESGLVERVGRARVLLNSM